MSNSIDDKCIRHQMILQNKNLEKIKLNLQELSLLIDTPICKTKIYCKEDIWTTIKPLIIPLDNSNGILQEGEIISNDSLVILRNSSQKILNVWKGKNMGVLSSHIHSDLSFEIEIFDLFTYYLIFDSKHKEQILGFLIHSLAKEMLGCFDIQEKPTPKGGVIEKMIDKLLDEKFLTQKEESQ